MGKPVRSHADTWDRASETDTNVEGYHTWGGGEPEVFESQEDLRSSSGRQFKNVETEVRWMDRGQMKWGIWRLASKL